MKYLLLLLTWMFCTFNSFGQNGIIRYLLKPDSISQNVNIVPFFRYDGRAAYHFNADVFRIHGLLIGIKIGPKKDELSLGNYWYRPPY